MLRGGEQVRYTGRDLLTLVFLIVQHVGIWHNFKAWKFCKVELQNSNILQ